jgi:hypothetical protein
MSVRRLIPLAALGAAALLLTACGSKLDTSSLEENIDSTVTAQVGGDWTVACPDDVTPTAGGTFQCTATSADGTVLTAEVTQNDDQGNVSWTINGGDEGTDDNSGSTDTESPAPSESSS